MDINEEEPQELRDATSRVAFGDIIANVVALEIIPSNNFTENSDNHTA